MTDIQVSLIEQDKEEYVFEVVISEKGSSTNHRVTVKESNYKEWTNREITPADLVERSIEFLLKKEPKESILKQFDLTEIHRYFPEYTEKVREFK